MKYALRILSVLLMITILAACQSNDEAEVVLFSDYQLEKVIREEINLPHGDIDVEALQDITELDASGQRIKSIDGIEYLDNVTTLHLQNNKIEDLSPLEDMDMLQEVHIGGNPYDRTIVDLLEAKEITVLTMGEVRGTEDGPGGFLWKVENDDTTVYLQGTIHLATEDFFPLNQKIEEAYATSNIIVPEIDLNNINLFEMQSTVMDLAMYQDGTTIQDHIPANSYEKLATMYSEMGYPIDPFITFKPWYHTSVLQSLMTEELGYIEGVDMYFLDRAKKDQKQVVALETVEEQLSVLAGVSPDLQVQMLDESFMTLDEFASQMEEMFDLYIEGDPDELLAYLMEEDADPSPEEQAYMEALNDKRNYNMAEKIIDFLEEDSGDTYFVIVGALHYLLEPHIISILEDEGYVVESVL